MIVNLLNVETFSVPITAERKYLPDADVRELADPIVTVIPKSLAIEPSNRASDLNEIVIDIGLRKKVDVNVTADLDDLMAVVVEVMDCVKAARVVGDYQLLKVENPAIYSVEDLRTNHVFLSVISVSYHITTDRG